MGRNDPSSEALAKEDCNHDAPAGEQLTRVPPGTLGLRPFASSDEAKFLSRSPQTAQVAAAHG